MLIHSYEQPRLPERVVLLGANGFLGRAMQRRLANEAVSIFPLHSAELDLTSRFAGDLLADILRPTDSVIILATVKPGRQLDKVAFQANQDIIAAICTGVRKARCGHLIYLSSDAIYPYSSLPVREDEPPNPDTLYGRMHLVRETAVQQVEGSAVATLRLTQVYGPGDPHNAYGPGQMLATAITEHRITLNGKGEETRDHVYIDDVVEVMFDVITRHSRGIINVATGHSISFAALAETVKGISGKMVEILQEPRRVPIKHRSFDTAVFHQAFPNRAFTPLETGLRTMAKYIKAARQSAGEPGSLSDKPQKNIL